MKHIFLASLLLATTLSGAPAFASHIQETVTDRTMLTTPTSLHKASSNARAFLEDLETRPTPTYQEMIQGLGSINFRDPATYDNAMDQYRPLTVFQLVCRDFDKMATGQISKDLTTFRNLFETGFFCIYLHQKMTLHLKTGTFDPVSILNPITKITTLHNGEFIDNYSDLLCKIENIDKNIFSDKSKYFNFLNKDQKNLIKVFFAHRVTQNQQKNLNDYLRVQSNFAKLEGQFEYCKKENLKKIGIIFNVLFKTPPLKDKIESDLSVFHKVLKTGSQEAYSKLPSLLGGRLLKSPKTSLNLSLTATRIWQDNFSTTANLCQKCYFGGLKDYAEEANAWVLLAEKRNHPNAQEMINNILVPTVSRSIQSFFESRNIEGALQVALKYQHIPVIQYTIGMLYEYLKQSGNAFIWYEKAAQSGYLQGQFSLGKLYYAAKDYPSAEKWWTRAAQNGFAPAQQELVALRQALKERDAHDRSDRNSDEENFSNLNFVKPISYLTDESGQLITRQQETNPQTPGDKGWKKRLARQRKKERAKEKKRLQKETELAAASKKASKTYRDVAPTVQPDAIDHMDGPHKEKIRDLLTYLAQGDTNRANFKPRPDWGENVFSMRITDGDRLFFKTQGEDISKGLEVVEIISAKSHGDKIRNHYLKSNQPSIPYPWEANQ